MEQYNVTGMSCAACSTRVEKAVSKVTGVTSCSVSLLTNSMGVEGNANVSDIIKAVEDAGYGASLKKNRDSKVENIQADLLVDKETPRLKKQLIASLVVLVILMYFSMGNMMWGWPLTGFLEGNPLAIGITQLLLTIIIMIINKKFFISGFISLWHKAPNMDTLVALGSSAAFVYSTYALFLMTGAYVDQNIGLAGHYMHEFYFESAAMILTLITVGKMLEARSKGRTTDALKGLMKLAPKTATLEVNGTEVEVPISEVKKGDLFIVRPGESIPVDGVVTNGNSAVNEAVLTGESIPIDKVIGSQVSAATVNQSGYLKCQATRVGEDTTLSQIIQMVSDAAATKAPIAKIADRVSGVFVPMVITLAVITIIIWCFTGAEIGYALARGISVLVISCPCALGLATPVAIMVGNGVGAKNGIMFKTAASLEETGKADIVVLDKTGTITTGKPVVTDIVPAQGVLEKKLIECAYCLESKSEHPLAKAIVEYAIEVGTDKGEVQQFQAVVGNGLQGVYNGIDLYGGKEEYIRKFVTIDYKYLQKANQFAKDGKTPLFFSTSECFLGIIAVADTMKEESPKAINELREMGIYVTMLTGDNEKTAQAIGKQAGVDQVIAGVLPDGKEQIIQMLQQFGKVVMVGDGINDAPALTRADMGIAIGAGTDIAIDAADVVLMKSNLNDVPAAIRLSRATLRNIHQNLFWAFFYNVIGIPLAAGVWIPIFHWELDPMFAAAAMSLSSFCVVTNALRLNFTRIYESSAQKKNQKAQLHEKINQEINKRKDNKMNKKTIKIEGMMCGHCEARVKKTLEALEHVSEAIVSHENGTAEITLTADIDDQVLRETIESQDYKVLDIQ